MKILIIGGGGREHAIIKSLKQSKGVTELYAMPGNAGMQQDAICVDINPKNLDEMEAFAVEKGIDFAVVAPDEPLVLGAVDRLQARGITCFGPNKAAAIIEGSKIFSKNLMEKYDIPTAQFAVFQDMQQALSYLDTATIPCVIKADGLALGKGVMIAQTRDEAKQAVLDMMGAHIFGDSGSQIVIEEFLTGPEVSVLTFTDGKTLVPMVSSMDHKRALDGDLGLNTGGMGAIAPNPFYTQEIAEICMETIFLPTINGMNAENRPFKGCLYFGLMLTEQGPKVIEYNCRFGDPEAQVVLPLLENDLLDVMMATANGALDEIAVSWKNAHTCCVILASKGYPQAYETGFEITIDTDIDAAVYVAGGKKQGEKLITNGGRVLGVTGIGDTLQEAIERAYTGVEHIHFNGAYHRKDIGKKALGRATEE